jgi:hypothetical protein
MRGAPYLVPLVALAVFGCRMADFAEREPWRNEAEQRCLAAHSLKSSRYLESAPEIGRGQCGMTQPFKVGAIGDGTLSLASNETQPQSFAARIQSVLGKPTPVALRERTPAQPVTVEPRPTLACPLITAIDRWMLSDVQPAAAAWFGESVVEIKQISAYACRSMNGQPGARISEHAFGNALDVAAFRLASGREVTVKDGWRGAADERGFLRQVHAAACERFSTVLGPGADAFHYDHFHLDLARRSNGAVCKPVPQEVTPRPDPTTFRTAERVMPAPPSAPTRKPSWPPSPEERQYDPYSISAPTAPRTAPRPAPAPSIVQRTPTPAAPRTPTPSEPDALFANRPLAQLPPSSLTQPTEPARQAPALPARTLPAPIRPAGEPLDLAPPPRIAMPRGPTPPAPVQGPALPAPRPGLRPPAPIPTATRVDPLVTGSVTIKRFYKDGPSPSAKLPHATPGED